MSLLRQAQPLTSDQLATLQDVLDPHLQLWAAHHSHVVDGEDNRLIRDLAALHAHSKARLGVLRLMALQEPPAQSPLHTPREIAGRAAGQLAVARLMMTWYGLEQDNLKRLADAAEVDQQLIGVPYQSLQDAVAYMPMRLGFTAFSSQEVFAETVRYVEGAYDAQGPAVLEPYAGVAGYLAG